MTLKKDFLRLLGKQRFRMKSSVKSYIRDMIRDPSYLFIVIFYLGISINSLFEIKKSALESSMAKELLIFTLQYLFFTLIIGYLLFLVMVCISSIVVPDKLSGRCEMLLANKVSIELLIKNYKKTIFFLCILPITIFTMAFLGIYFFNGLHEIILNAWNLVFLLVFLLFSLSLIEMIIYICLIVKRVEVIRTILSFSSIGFMFIVMAPVNLMRNKGWILDKNHLILAISFILFVLSVVFLLVTLAIKRNYSNEHITLSFRQ